jgi:hypothetical protein
MPWSLTPPPFRTQWLDFFVCHVCISFKKSKKFKAVYAQPLGVKPLDQGWGPGDWVAKYLMTNLPQTRRIEVRLDAELVVMSIARMGR